MDGPWADVLTHSLSSCISTLIAARSMPDPPPSPPPWHGGTTEAPVVGVDGVVGDDTDEEVVCDEVDGDEVPEEEVVEALDAGEAEGAGEGLLAPLPPLFPLPFLGFALPPVPSGLVWVGIATNAVAACSPCLKPQRVL